MPRVDAQWTRNTSPQSLITQHGKNSSVTERYRYCSLLNIPEHAERFGPCGWVLELGLCSCRADQECTERESANGLS